MCPPPRQILANAICDTLNRIEAAERQEASRRANTAQEQWSVPQPPDHLRASAILAALDRALLPADRPWHRNA